MASYKHFAGNRSNQVGPKGFKSGHSLRMLLHHLRGVTDVVMDVDTAMAMVADITGVAQRPVVYDLLSSVPVRLLVVNAHRE